jgi:hypothetical protein
MFISRVGQNPERPIVREYQAGAVTNEGWRIASRVVLTPFISSPPR